MIAKTTILGGVSRASGIKAETETMTYSIITCASVFFQNPAKLTVKRICRANILRKLFVDECEDCNQLFLE